MTIALPPFPLIPVMLGIVAGIDEVEVTHYIYKTYKLKSLLYFLIPASVRVAGLLAWNYYRFGSILVTGYGLIPGVLLVPFIINKQNWWLIVLGVAQFALVLAHGYTGAYQFDFRFLMDSLWIFVPLLLLEKRYLRQVMIWGCFIFALIMHIP